MVLRVPQVSLLLGSLLLVSMAGVMMLEDRLGGAIVPSVVVVDAPQMSAGQLWQIRKRWPPVSEVASFEFVPCDAGPLQPFGPRLTRWLSRRGDTTALFSLEDALDPEHAAQWGWVSMERPDPGLSREVALAQLVSETERFVKGQWGVNPFLAALAAGPTPADADELFAPLFDAVLKLPGYRLRALVVLSEHTEDAELGPGRWYLRLNVGRWLDRARPALKDLLQPGW